MKWRMKPILVGLFLAFCSIFPSAEAYDVLDPNGNIKIIWDIKTWTPDGYVATVTVHNYQQYRHIDAPGWRLGWTWLKEEVIWSMVGAQATEQGDCSKFKDSIPHCCKRTPTVVDLLPGTPYNNQVANCCKGGVISSLVQDPENSIASFQISVGRSDTRNKTSILPGNYTFHTPGPGYTCGPAEIGTPSKFTSPDGRRVTQAMMTWTVTCTYSQFLAQKAPTCCVALSAFYNKTIVSCPTCTCGCPRNATTPGSCIKEDTPYLLQSKINAPLVQCTSHMCPIKVHWHIKRSYRQYWRVKITVNNFNYGMNYSQWNIVAQHPNFNNLTQLFSFNYKSLIPYGSINDTALFWGIKFYNELLMEAGNAQSEVLFQKDDKFSFQKGWAFPRRIYFNGDNCVMPPPDAYPWLPNDASPTPNILSWIGFLWAVLVFLFNASMDDCNNFGTIYYLVISTFRMHACLVL